MNGEGGENGEIPAKRLAKLTTQPVEVRANYFTREFSTSQIDLTGEFSTTEFSRSCAFSPPIGDGASYFKMNGGGGEDREIPAKKRTKLTTQPVEVRANKRTVKAIGIL